MTADQCGQKVTAGELKDSALGAHLKSGYTVKKVQLDITVDRSSLNYFPFLEMHNPGFNSERKRISTSVPRKPARRVRVCAAQYQQRAIKSWDDLAYTVEFFFSKPAMTTPAIICCCPNISPIKPSALCRTPP
ncbi:MAG: hypothetical protein O3B73_16060 [bacterium]|nr:hypothetical protein [bacterium]